MRQPLQEQLPLAAPGVDHRHTRELAEIDRILGLHPDVLDLVLQDLHQGIRSDTGREGMTAEQVLRVAVLRALGNFTYEELTFFLPESPTYRSFCGYGLFDEIPAKSTLQRNVKRIGADTWQAINHVLLGYARAERVEDGRTTRTDATVVETNIHPPTDSSLLWDSVRVLDRLLKEAHEDFGIERFPSRRRRAKRRALDILNAKKERKRRKAYRDLLKVSEETVGYARSALAQLHACPDLMAAFAAAEIEKYVHRAEWVIDQTERRVLHGEDVPATEKLFSIFEPHTDIIIKDRRDTHYGHKLTLTGGKSGLVLDWVVEDGNPADSTLATRMLERHKNVYGRVPRQAAFDGGFASKANLKEAKDLGVKDVAFSKKRGLEVPDMARSRAIYKRLRNFRAGIESWISYLKRAFGLERCVWRGEAGFARYVGSSIVAGNLLTLARHLLARAAT